MAVNGSHPLVLRLVSSSLAIAHRAGNIIRDILKKGDLGIVDKGVNDLQTEADRSAQQCIVESLKINFPKITVIGEEDLDTNASVDPNWIETGFNDEVLQCKCPKELQGVTDEQVVVWVDPLDGTTEFTQGLLEHVTVLIGVAVNGKAVGGVIYQPYYNYKAEAESPLALGRAIWGITGIGAFGFKKVIPQEDKNIVATTRSHSNVINTEAVSACQPSEVIKVGGSGHKVLLILEGKAHAYVFASKGTKKWDTCAPEAVLRASGGTLSDIHGCMIPYDASVQHMNTGGVLATSSNHQWYIDHMPLSARQNLPS